MQWRRALTPAIVLAVLLLALAFRWNTEATAGASRLERDRWTGRLWEMSYSNYGLSETALSDTYPVLGIFLLYDRRDADIERAWFSWIWAAATASAGVWLVVVLRKRQPEG